MASSTCRLLLADDHAMFRQGLRALLDKLPDISVIGEATDGFEAVERARLLRPDVVLMDAQMPRRSGVDAMIELRAGMPDARVIILGGDADDPRAMYEAIRNGAMGYVPKANGVDDLIGAIRQVAQGHAALPAASLTRLVGFIVSGPAEPAPADHDGLSEREQDVLALVAQGRSNREIAEALCIAESTVRSHLHNILSKLNLANRVQAAAFALGHRDSRRTATAA
jgi:NarL family two-component system response regulator LiaR